MTQKKDKKKYIIKNEKSVSEEHHEQKFYNRVSSRFLYFPLFCMFSSNENGKQVISATNNEWKKGTSNRKNFTKFSFHIFNVRGLNSR